MNKLCDIYLRMIQKRLDEAKVSNNQDDIGALKRELFFVKRYLDVIEKELKKIEKEQRKHG